MNAARFTESQIVAILKQQDSGQTVAQITREHGISEATAPAARLLQLAS
ncbi:Transposase [Spirosoma endophyticum]|uniref:Transposase n=1 Tax=Spirosoma endophyticum TaxID=662367 RepID=A0A1I2DP69_9BACT|nr:transposase [Spirosoma endophyticum]SFE82422.1 Transposase [Spirosoma endophyticum]